MKKFSDGQRCCVVFLALALVSVPVSAWSEEPVSVRLALASKIVSNPANQLGQEEFEAVLTDAIARPIFKKVRADSDWGPEHPTWNRLFPEFSASFGRLNTGSLSGLEERLVTALANSLTEQELAEVSATEG